MLATSGLLCVLLLRAQGPLSQQMGRVREMAETKHIEPKKIDDAFSVLLYHTFIDNLDPDKMYLTADDRKTLEKYRLSLDEEWQQSATTFFTEAASLYKQRMRQVADMITAVCAKPFEFGLPEYFILDDSATAPNEKALARKWYLLLKADVLQRLGQVAGTQLDTRKAIYKTEVLSREREFREKVKAKYLNGIQRFIGSELDFTKEMSSLYINSFLSCLDPHSDFYDATARQNFESQVSSEAFAFGFSIADNDKGEVVVVQLQPGGPAWMSGMINKDDVLLFLKWAGKEAVDVAGMEASEVEELLDQSNTEKLELTVRKANGKMETVVLQKRKLENDENIVKSYVLKGDKKVGYITLPSFYTVWEDASGSRCAEDVAKEVIKLKKDSVEGLILDLRFNGGGSLQEAIQMAGIFIDEGAIAQMRTKDPKITILKDMNRGVVYNGPLLVLVNGYSASASELLAASLQDYNRAIIAGSRTYGKATGQQVLPVHALKTVTIYPV